MCLNGMLKTGFLLLALLPVGCGKAGDKSAMPDRQLDTRLQFYLDEFRTDAQKYNVHIDGALFDSLRVMKFVPDVDAEKIARGQELSGEEGTIGTCATFQEDKTINTGVRTLRTKSLSWSEVWIDTDLASEQSHPMALKELMYHELGHCLLGLDHVQPKPHAIMSPEMSLNGRWLTQNWAALLTEFFASVRK